MLSYLSSFIWPEEEIKVDQKVLRQKYLVLVQIKDHRLRLKPIKKINPVIPPYKKPNWKKLPVIL
jgi:hypothetical protein